VPATPHLNLPTLLDLLALQKYYYKLTYYYKLDLLDHYYKLITSCNYTTTFRVKTALDNIKGNPAASSENVPVSCRFCQEHI
jgi:hypothetical protein